MVTEQIDDAFLESIEADNNAGSFPMTDVSRIGRCKMADPGSKVAAQHPSMGLRTYCLQCKCRARKRHPIKPCLNGRTQSGPANGYAIVSGPQSVFSGPIVFAIE